MSIRSANRDPSALCDPSEPLRRSAAVRNARSVALFVGSLGPPTVARRWVALQAPPAEYDARATPVTLAGLRCRPPAEQAALGVSPAPMAKRCAGSATPSSEPGLARLTTAESRTRFRLPASQVRALLGAR